MPRVLTNGKIKIGVYMLPGRKRPVLCKEEDGEVIVYGSFRGFISAENFMDELAKLTGAKKE